LQAQVSWSHLADLWAALLSGKRMPTLAFPNQGIDLCSNKCWVRTVSFDNDAFGSIPNQAIIALASHIVVRLEVLH
jgi:hypothetical protein